MIYWRVQTPLKSWLFQASIRNCLNCVRNCEDHSLLDFKSAVQYMKHFINHFTSILHGLIRTHKWPAPNVSGFIAQLVRVSHRYREVKGSNLIEVLTFSGFYTQLILSYHFERFFGWKWKGRRIICKVNFLSPENDQIFMLCLWTSVSWPSFNLTTIWPLVIVSGPYAANTWLHSLNDSHLCAVRSWEDKTCSVFLSSQ